MKRSTRCSLALAVAWLVLFASPLPSSAQAQQAKAKKIATVEGVTEYQLDNGAKLLLFPDPAASTITVNMTVLVGSRHEGYGESGMAHLLEHMCFKGTPTYPNIDKAQQEHGGSESANGTTWLDRTNYFMTMPSNAKNLDFGFKLSADMLVNSFVKKEDLDKEFSVVRSEFERSENDPGTILSQRMTAAAFEWHNYGKSTIGNRADIERVPIENLKAFYRKYYQPDNIVMVCGGKFDEQKAVEAMEKYFGALKRPTRVLQQTYTEEPAQDGERQVILRRVGKVAVVGAMYHIPSVAHEDYAAIDVLSTILQQEPQGRLYKALVKTKLATNVSASNLATHDPYVLEISATVANKVAPQEVLDTLLNGVEKFGDTKVTDAEVARAKKVLAVDFERKLANRTRTPIEVELSEWIGAGDWRLFFLHRDRVAKVTAQDVEKVAKKYLKKSNRTVGMFLPTETPDRTAIPEFKDLPKLIAGYKGAPPQPAGEDFDPSPENLEKRTKRFTLPSGMKAALLPKKTRGEMVVGAIVLRYGNEKALLGLTTASGYLGPLMMRGTTKYNYEQIQDMLDELGATLSVGGSSGALTCSLECKRDKLADVLKILQEILRNPTFPEDELAILKSETRQSLEAGLTDPQRLASNALARKLNPYPKDSIHYVPTIAESIERLGKVTRADILKIYNEQLGAQVGSIVFVGDFEEKAVMKQVETMLQGKGNTAWKAATPYVRIPSVVKTDVPGGKEKIETPDKENAIYVAGYQIAMDDSDKDYPAMLMGSYVLGQGGFNSRILIRLRQQEGLSYGAGSSFSAGTLDKAGSFGLYAICNPTNMTKLDKSMQELIEEFAKKGVTKAELDDTIKGWLQERKVDRSSDGTVLGQLTSQTYLGRTYQRTIAFEKQIAEVTVEQVNAAIQRHFHPGRFYIVEAGDFAKGAKK